MQNIRTLNTVDFAKDIATKDYQNPSYHGIVHNAFKKYLLSEEIR